ncbi:hypothetical protein Sp245p_03385 [Azospirillum baldaniorum]|uniref:Uncharacterized protein n=1 Tax=Azospirillum baldaniorum TaxID=1064539 RepID=A0A9P1NN62_9PROT|nr:hypothetical protein [Azospirillum baldaniorum]AWJ88897.1 hypothetical protein Sp245p_03385 [Azospirillum baldaniorum]TWA73392.1 hypothetical protein FBZ85_11684 [Azospirillum brasilense]CCC99395.1 protein of unknown function [Azospirillum baldaniorum]
MAAEAFIENGSPCPDGCGGVLHWPEVENCSCHISAPCGNCTDNRLICNECGWEEPAAKNAPLSKESQDAYAKWAREWAEAKARGHKFQHGGRVFNISDDGRSGSTMVFTGQYEGPVTAADIFEYLGDGTFGHRGPTMNNGRFTYTKITD